MPLTIKQINTCTHKKKVLLYLLACLDGGTWAKRHFHNLSLLFLISENE